MTMHEDPNKAPAHKTDTGKLSEEARDETEEEGRDDTDKGRTARDATGINPKKTEPTDPAMPNMPPA